jgi:RimJ/RimL family protein N-acetyltransferase
VSTLFHRGDTAYLAWVYTGPSYRGRGFQTDAIRLRTRDAFGLGAKRVFTVTDFNFTSPRNLQRCGMRLAYNYLLVRRDPLPL